MRTDVFSVGTHFVRRNVIGHEALTHLCSVRCDVGTGVYIQGLYIFKTGRHGDHAA
jgi:hypothetical protein